MGRAAFLMAACWCPPHLGMKCVCQGLGIQQAHRKYQSFPWAPGRLYPHPYPLLILTSWDPLRVSPPSGWPHSPTSGFHLRNKLGSTTSSLCQQSPVICRPMVACLGLSPFPPFSIKEVAPLLSQFAFN
ncbi:hypothetical protein HJG60_011231 [Phyllostomus discolor]|uniref:Secreted protein n=1 Tax=Phyllostomus discolor TaxID=89673 RepID=A0A834E577_9CHIR|nr:hypothetical protein HJG60_011231 [Phyllostomus discolor]